MSGVSDPVILLTNDDGIDAVGLRTIHDRLTDRARVVTVAPDEDRSGAGLTMNTYISVAEHELGYQVSGTPADCVQLATSGPDFDPDLVVSGCNPGPNIGTHPQPVGDRRRRDGGGAVRRSGPRGLAVPP